MPSVLEEIRVFHPKRHENSTLKNRMVAFLFTGSLFISAFLLFLVQPIFAKMVLPRLGGVPAVWNTCMFFFQLALLAGYCYAHMTPLLLGVTRQAWLHLVLLLLPFWFLPIRLNAASIPPPDANPIPYLLGWMTTSVALPFFVVSTTAPLIQKWFSHLHHPAAEDPYFLYAASNAGSLSALICYPLVIEPHLKLSEQGNAWSFAYTLFVLLMAGCFVVLKKSLKTSDPIRETNYMDSAQRTQLWLSREIPWKRRLRWVMLAFVPSSLMLGVTTYMSTDIASVPLIWIIPLGLYLLTFILAFAKKHIISHDLVLHWFPLVIVPVSMLVAMRASTPMEFVIPVHLLGFWMAAMACHGELAKDRPSRDHLTEFYLWISVGGMMGGVFNALIAPLTFNQVLEYALVLTMACLLIPRAGDLVQRTNLTTGDVLLPAGFGLFLLGVFYLIKVFSLERVIPYEAFSFLIFALPTVVCFSFQRRLIRFGLGLGVYMLAGLCFYFSGDEPLLIRRSFFGVSRVSLDRKENLLRFVHGSTLHGQQSLDPARRSEPLAYFHRTGPIGQVFENVSRLKSPDLTVGVMGLGVGSLAAYAQTDQNWDFYEIDPVVKSIATNSGYFSFLKDCRAHYRIIMGDGRLSLVRVRDHSYSLLILDVFGSDSIPVHVMTEDAIRLYLNKLKKDGILAVNISSRYLNLERLFVSLAHSLNLAGFSQFDSLEIENGATGKLASQWVILGRDPSDLRELAADSRWTALPVNSPEVKPWTDDISNIVSVIRGF